MASGMGFESIGGALSGLSGALSAAAPVVGAVTQGLGMLAGAVQTAIKEFLSIPDKIRPFVQAFAPSSVLVFDQAIRDVSAVIGSALVPVMNASTEVVRAFGEALLPVMRQLEPALRQLAQETLQYLIPMTKQVVAGLGPLLDGVLGLADALRPMLPLFDGLFDSWRTFNALFVATHVALIDFSTALISGWTALLGLTDGYASAGDALRQFSLGLLRVVATIAKLVGAESFLASLRRSFSEQPRGSTVGFAAATNAKIETAPEWARQLAVQASMAAGAAGKSPEDAFRDEVSKMLKDISNEKVPSLTDAIRDGFKEFFKKIDQLPDTLAGRLSNKPLKKVSEIRQFGMNASRAEYDFAQRLLFPNQFGNQQ